MNVKINNNMSEQQPKPQNEMMPIISAFKNPEFKKRFITASGLTEAHFEREISFANIAIASNSLLKQCSVESILKAVFSVATIGLSLNPVLKYAALTPRYIAGRYEASLTPMYQGLSKLATDAGNISVIQTHIVHEGDEFEIKLGNEYTIVHSPKFASKIISGAYSIARLKDGNNLIEYMTAEEIEAIREFSDSWKSYKAGRMKPENCIWLKHESEMFRKTVLKRMLKYLPKGINENLANALAVDESDYVASIGKTTYIESLLANCTLEPEEIVNIERRISDPQLSNMEADIIIDRLKANQLPSAKDEYQQRVKNPSS